MNSEVWCCVGPLRGHHQEVMDADPHPCCPCARCCCRQQGVGVISARLSSDSGMSTIWGIPSSDTCKKPQFPTYKEWVWEVGETLREREKKDKWLTEKIQQTKWIIQRQLREVLRSPHIFVPSPCAEPHLHAAGSGECSPGAARDWPASNLFWNVVSSGSRSPFSKAVFSPVTTQKQPSTNSLFSAPVLCNCRGRLLSDTSSQGALLSLPRHRFCFSS